jgi:uncharacterized RDD family membrane protein YckC
MNVENPYAPPRAAVSDIRGPSEEPELAGRGIRLGAALLDMAMLIAIIVLPLVFGGAVAGSGTDVRSDLWSVAAILMMGGILAYIVVTTIYVARNGQTIAKKLLGIKVVRTDGTKASLGRIFWLRFFVNYLLGFIPAYSLVDPLLIFSDSRQCIHDKLADTIVVVA